MAWLKIETSVARNRKFVQAGPAPAWLWVCGLAYCQEGLTDGFIPSEAIDYLGVKNAKNLAVRLEVARLWEKVDGGWQIHDYLEHNKPASEIRRVTKLRADGGNLGGRPKVNLKGKPSDTAKANHTENPSTAVAVATAVPEATAPAETCEPVDDEWASFVKAYPSQGRYPSRLASEMFLDARRSGVTFASMMTALSNHKVSEQWAVSGKIPNLTKWLEEKRWEGSLPPPKAVAGGRTGAPVKGKYDGIEVQ